MGLTPCIGVCKLDPHTNLCVGCKRTLEEIAKWQQYTDAQKQEIIKNLLGR